MRYVKSTDDTLEFDKKPAGVKLDLDARAHMRELHRKPDLVGDLGVDHCKSELAWRHRFLEVMQWERYFCKEIKDNFQGPMWKHDPDTNPVRSRAEGEPPAGGAATAVGGGEGDGP
jgi:hypothetical protein